MACTERNKMEEKRHLLIVKQEETEKKEETSGAYPCRFAFEVAVWIAGFTGKAKAQTRAGVTYIEKSHPQ